MNAEHVDDVMLESQKPILNAKRNLTVKLERFRGSSKHWVSRELFFPLTEEPIRYRYIVKFKQGWGSKFYGLFRSTDQSIFVVRESKYRKLKNEGVHQYDTFNKPGDNSVQNIFAGRLFYIQMLYSHLEEGYNLKAILIECEHVEFGHASYSREDRSVFFDWIKDVSKGGLKFRQAAFLCSLMGQFVKRVGFTWTLGRCMTERSADWLLSSLKFCFKYDLPTSSLSHIAMVASNLFEAGSRKDFLSFVMYFCYLLDVDFVIKEAGKYQLSYAEKMFDTSVADAVDHLKLIHATDDCTSLLMFILLGVPSIACLWNLYHLISSSLPQLMDALSTKFQESFSRFISPSRARKPDLLEVDLWSKTPPTLKKPLADIYCKALMEQINSKASWTKENLENLKTLALDKHLQSSKHAPQLMSWLMKSKDEAVLMKARDILDSQEVAPFWKGLTPDSKHQLCNNWLESTFRLAPKSGRSKKPNDVVLQAFESLEMISKTHFVSQDEKLCSALVKDLLCLLERVDLDTIIDLYKDTQSLSQSGEVWLQQLLRATIQRKSGTGNLRSRMRKLIQTLKSDEKRLRDNTAR